MYENLEDRINEELISRGIPSIDFSMLPTNVRDGFVEAFELGFSEGCDTCSKSE